MFFYPCDLFIICYVCIVFVFINLLQKPEKEDQRMIPRGRNQSVLWLVHSEFLFLLLFFFFLKNTVLKKKKKKKASISFDHFPGWILHILRRDRFYLCRLFTGHTVDRGRFLGVERHVGNAVNGRMPFQRGLPVKVGTLWMSPQQPNRVPRWPAQLSMFLSLTFHLCSWLFLNSDCRIAVAFPLLSLCDSVPLTFFCIKRLV